MAKRKRSAKRPQPNHKPARGGSQFDKRQRLERPNPQRAKTTEPKVPLVGFMAEAVGRMSGMLDRRIAFRLLIICAGMMFADDRRVAAAWFVSAGVQDDWDRFYDCLISIGKNSRQLALPLAITVLHKFARGSDRPIRVAIDDSPTKRYGKCVEGAGVHHHPTPGPADGEWLYGHNWVCLCLLATHPLWGVIALPLLSWLYVRAVDVPGLDAKYGWKFQTKHQLAVDLIDWLVGIVRSLELSNQIWLVADGAYASSRVIGPLRKHRVVFFSRLRKDAQLFDLPAARQPGQRGRPRKYGVNRISLAKRAAHRDGWESTTYRCRGENVTRQCKSFLATSRFAGGVIRVVIVRFADESWAAYFCTDPNIAVVDILETVSARWAIEEHFHDVKEVWGAGQQQVCNIWSNVGCWHLNQWMYTLVELSSWDDAEPDMFDRAKRPWDNQDRRPSHADKRRAISKKMLEKHFLVNLPPTAQTSKIRQLIADLISMVA